MGAGSSTEGVGPNLSSCCFNLLKKTKCLTGVCTVKQGLGQYTFRFNAQILLLQMRHVAMVTYAADLQNFYVQDEKKLLKGCISALESSVNKKLNFNHSCFRCNFIFFLLAVIKKVIAHSCFLAYSEFCLQSHFQS